MLTTDTLFDRCFINLYNLLEKTITRVVLQPSNMVGCFKQTKTKSIIFKPHLQLKEKLKNKKFPI